MGLIAHYKLDGNANDALGKYNGTAPGALVFEYGKLGKCINLKTSGSVTFPTSIKHTYSVSFWYKRLSPPDGAYQKIFTKGSDRSPGFWTGSSDFLHLRQSLVNGGNSGADIYEIGTGVWRHIVFTCEQTAAGVRINSYMDGVKSTSSSFYAGDTVNITGDPNSFVLNSNSAVGHSLDDVRIYDHALSEREVRDLAQGLVLHYTFDQFQEPTENKASGVTYPSYAPYHSISGDASRVVMTCAATNPYMTIAGFGTLQGNMITVSGYMKKNGASYLPPLDKTSTYETATAVKHVMYSSTGRFEVTQVYNSTSAWLFHTPITAVAGDVITIDDFQVEFNKGYATPFVNGKRAGIVRDQSTQGNDAPLALANTPKWVEGGMVGKGCYELEQTKYITLPKNTLGSLTNCTFSFWRKRTSAGSWIVGNSGTPTGGSYFMATSGGTGAFYHSGVGTPVIYRDGVLSTTPANDDLWHHYCLVGADLSTWVNLRINAYNMGTTWLFRGQIDDVRIYATALSAEEIKELYQQRASLDSGGNLLC